jgi:hypothetical protein
MCGTYLHVGLGRVDRVEDGADKSSQAGASDEVTLKKENKILLIVLLIIVSNPMLLKSFNYLFNYLICACTYPKKFIFSLSLRSHLNYWERIRDPILMFFTFCF